MESSWRSRFICHRLLQVTSSTYARWSYNLKISSILQFFHFSSIVVMFNIVQNKVWKKYNEKEKEDVYTKFVGNVNQAIGFQLSSVVVFIYWKKNFKYFQITKVETKIINVWNIYMYPNLIFLKAEWWITFLHWWLKLPWFCSWVNFARCSLLVPVIIVAVENL